MNRSNVPYIVAAALLVLAIGGWGIFLTGGNHEVPAETDAGVDAGADGGEVSGDAGVDSGGMAVADAGVALAPPPRRADAGTDAGVDGSAVSVDAGDATSGVTSTTDAGLALPSEPVDTTAPVEKKAAISPEAIRGVIAGMKPAAKLCYESLLKEFPEASGDVTVSFRIEAEQDEGRVTIIEVDERTTLIDDKMLTCLTDAFGDAVFPVPEGGDTVQVTYPFKFATK